MRINDFDVDGLKKVQELAASIHEAAQLMDALYIHSSWGPTDVSDWLLSLQATLDDAQTEIWALIHDVNRTME